MHLIATAGKRRQKLNERVMTEGPLDTVGLAVAFQTEGDDLILVVGELKSGGFVTVLEGTRRNEGRLIGVRLQRPLGKRMMRLRPQVIIGAVTVPAAFRTGVGGEIG